MSDQAAIRALAEARRLIVKYWHDDGDECREHHAQTKPIDEVVQGLLIDLSNMQKLYLAECGRVDPLHDEIERLRAELADTRRPMSAQMEMQNRRIIALTAELDRLRLLPETNEAGRP